MKNEEIDFTDIPELVNPKKVIVGKFYRPIKKSLTIRIDADVLEWVKVQGKGYQTRINGLLRKAMQTTNRRLKSKKRHSSSPALPNRKPA